MKEREPRSSVLIAARMRADSAPKAIHIRNVSSRGLMIEVEPAPPRGTFIEIARPGLTIVGQVIWSRDGRCGVRTRDRIDLRLLRTESAPVDAPAAAPIQAKPTPARLPGALHDVSAALARAGQFAVLALSGGVAALGLSSAAYAILADAAVTISKNL